MDYKAIIKICKEMGCCEACCVRYCALRKPTIFGDIRQFIKENTDAIPENPLKPEDEEESSGTPAKRRKINAVCVSCLGILQEDGWEECLNMTKEVMDNKKYECSTFACALSAPLATLIREKAVLLKLTELFPDFNSELVTPLKEAWKWSLGPRLALRLGLTLDSGALAALMLTLNMDYKDDSLESDVFSPSAESSRRHAPVTRCLLDRALYGISLERLLSLCGWAEAPAAVGDPARCVAVEACHAPLYLGGRYIKLSRALSQSPWVLRGVRLLESSVQEIICQPIADKYGLSPEESEHRLKFVSAGREDVDVRCLGDGRPFAIEIADPRRALSADELADVCERISQSGQVVVRSLVPIHKDKLVELKKGEESKMKTYEALCIKLTHTKEDILDGATAATPVRVHARDVAAACRAGEEGEGEVLQLTPLRVLHRRALLRRARTVRPTHAALVPGHAALFTVQVVTQAGTYVKEWAHGELGRTRPALPHALGARTDILALDVTCVQLDWP